MAGGMWCEWPMSPPVRETHGRRPVSDALCAWDRDLGWEQAGEPTEAPEARQVGTGRAGWASYGDPGSVDVSSGITAPSQVSGGRQGPGKGRCPTWVLGPDAAASPTQGLGGGHSLGAACLPAGSALLQLSNHLGAPSFGSKSVTDTFRGTKIRACDCNVPAVQRSTRELPPSV